ncbi:MAG TPA: transglycosylase SLT domain-containing protein [Acidobacteriota bacterium]|nr:transglycosylase SLT domain-containing protein [Acidobacteriota bacterium]
MPKTRPLQFAFLVAACAIAAAYQIISGKTMSAASPEGAAEVEAGSALSSNFVTSALPVPHGPLLLPKVETSSSTLEKEQARLEAAFDALVEQQATTDTLVERLARTDDSIQDHSLDPTPRKQNFSLLAYYVFSEITPDEKPADTVLKTMKDLPIGTPVEEIKRASDAFGLDFNFMKAVAKIESGFNPKQRTGSYIGLFQLSNNEFNEYGSGDITNPRDNAIGGAYKFATEALRFEFGTGRKPTFSDLYLIHQQGWQGAAQHVSHPKRIAWKSMCATDEGKEKGERWCKLAIWRNTLPAIKHVWKSVDKLTSGAFVGMWQQRVDKLYSQYSVATTKN